MVGSWHQPHGVVQMFAPGGGGRVSGDGGRGEGGLCSGLCSGLGCGVICAEGEPEPYARMSTTPKATDDRALTTSYLSLGSGATRTPSHKTQKPSTGTKTPT